MLFIAMTKKAAPPLGKCTNHYETVQIKAKDTLESNFMNIQAKKKMEQSSRKREQITNMRTFVPIVPSCSYKPNSNSLKLKKRGNDASM